MKTRNSIYGVLAVCSSILLIMLNVYCNGSPNSALGGTGAGNAAIAGRVVYPDGMPVKGATVRARPERYVADTLGVHIPDLSENAVDVLTDADGLFCIDSIDTGAYMIEVVDAGEEKGTMIRHYCSNSGIDTLPSRIVSPVARVLGEIIVQGLPANAWVQVYGTEITSKTDALGKFEIPVLPVGKCEENECEYTLKVVVTKDGVPVVYDYEMEVEWKAGGTFVEVELESGLDD